MCDCRERREEREERGKRREGARERERTRKRSRVRELLVECPSDPPPTNIERACT
jgi:hypothetical protein